MAYATINRGEGDEDAARKMADLFGPGQVDQSLRQAIQMCWMALPEGRRTPQEVEKQMRRLLDRALEDLREDREQFGGKL